MDKEVAVIIASGQFAVAGPVANCLDRAQLIICADGGGDHAVRSGIKPHVLMGDWDSISAGARAKLVEQGVEVIPFPKDKDKTDTELALEYAARAGAREVYLLGASGSRLDHTLANLFLLTKGEDLGLTVSLVDSTNQVWLVKERINLGGEEGQYISLLPLSPQVKGVTTAGLKYPLREATLVWGSTWGVSNQFTGQEASVSVNFGSLVVIQVWGD